jgi:hypothetical protein
MDDPYAAAPDLFDEPRRVEPARQVGAIAPIRRRTENEAEEQPVLALRWPASRLALVLSATFAGLSHFPTWAVAALALFAAGMSLWPLPRWGTRLWLIVAGSFSFAECTAIFVNQPFAWSMRFGFSAVLLTALAFFRAAADD